MSARRGGQIEPRGDRKFRVRVFLYRDEKGKRVYRSEMVNGTISEARKKLAAMQNNRDTGRLVKRANETVLVRALARHDSQAAR